MDWGLGLAYFYGFPQDSDTHQSVRTTAFECQAALVFLVNDSALEKLGGRSIVICPRALRCFRHDIFLPTFQSVSMLFTM